jgi:hypothetical protein
MGVACDEPEAVPASLDGNASSCQSRLVKSCGPSGSQDLAFAERADRPPRSASYALLTGRFLGETEGDGFEPSRGLTTPSDFRTAASRMAAIGTPLEHIAGALWTSADFYGLGPSDRPRDLQGNRRIHAVDALNS